MYRLFCHFFSISTFISFILVIYIIFLKIFKNKINSKLYKVLFLLPLIVSIIHFFAFYLHASAYFTISKFISMYIFSIIVALWQFSDRNKKIFNISFVIILIMGFVSFFLVFYNTILFENIHNLTYYNYTKSFNKTINILKKEYVLNEHKKIDYDYLYNKYYPLIKQAELNNDEQLYFKTMYEFSKNFKDGHVQYGIKGANFYDTAKKYSFISDYNDKYYGFGSVLLSDGRVAAILVDNNAEAYNKGLRDGMIITKKDGTNIHDLLNEIITPNISYPVLEDKNLLDSFYLFSTGNDVLELSFLNDKNEEVTITVNSIVNESSNSTDLFNKIIYQNDLENLDTKMLDENTGYIYINNEFYSPLKGAIGYLLDDSSYLTKEIDKKLKELKNKGMENLIIDLRNNTGGYFTESEAIASLFTSDNYLVLQNAKYNSKLYDKSYLNGNGKYSNIQIIVLVNSDTISAGDSLVYMFKNNQNAKIIGFTNSNNSAQSVGGIIFLSGGSSYIGYPIYKTLDRNDDIFIDTDSTGVANIKLDYRINLTQDNIKEIFYSDKNYDYELNIALQMLD